MLRRLCALILMLACALAPVLPAQALTADAEDCCCGATCPCPVTDCAPLPGSPTVPVPTNIAAVEQRAEAKKPAARAARQVFALFLSVSETDSAPALRLSSAQPAAPAASVALFQAHCSLRL